MGWFKPKPRCRGCNTRHRPLCWRNLFDDWFCPRCEYAHARQATEQLVGEIEKALRAT